MPAPIKRPRTLYDKVFDDHIVYSGHGDTILYCDRHLVHEVTSPQAFEGLRKAGRKVRRPDCTLATMDHNVPYVPALTFIVRNVLQMAENVREFGVTFFGLGDKRQGIVHIIGPEQGFTLPGTVVVCGDSHTSTHGVFGALTFGMGTSEVDHVLATQCIPQNKSKNMRVNDEGRLPEGVNSKDIVLYIIGIIGTAGGSCAVIEYSGSTIRALSMEARMSICNMSIEGGARAGMIAPDETTFDHLKGRPLAPMDGEEWDQAETFWRTLRSDAGTKYDIEVEIRAEDIAPTVTWGTSPQDVVSITGNVPMLDALPESKRADAERSLEYMGLKSGTRMEDIVIDKAFIGSCTHGRIEDMRSAARVIVAATRNPDGPSKVAAGVEAIGCPWF